MLENTGFVLPCVTTKYRRVSLEGGGAGHLRLGEAESAEQFLVDGRQQLAIGLGQLDFLHREVGVEISHVERRQLHTRARDSHRQ